MSGMLVRREPGQQRGQPDPPDISIAMCSETGPCHDGSMDPVPKIDAPRRHHLVTRSYLEGFSLPGSGDKLFAIDAKRGTTFTTSAKNLAVEKDFYRTENSTGDPYLVEKMLGEIETAVLPVIRRIEETLELPTGTD